MILKNLLRRKGRTLLTVLGIAIGVAAIVAMGALADGLEAGYGSMMAGSKADLVLSQPNSFDISFSSVEASAGDSLAAMPEVAAVSGMLQGFAQVENEPFFFVFGYPEDSFVLDRFQIIQGDGFQTRRPAELHGTPVLLGSAAAEVLGKSPGDTLRMTGSVFRVLGVYQTGDAFEDSGAVLRLPDAQELLGKSRQVSLFYIQLKAPGLRQRFSDRIARQWPDLLLSGTGEFANKQSMQDILRGYVWVIGGLAIIIGGVGMMNAQLMAVFERTREIGVLRAVGWSRARILWLILGESISVCLAGGLLGTGMSWLILSGLSNSTVLLRMVSATPGPELLLQAFGVVFTLGLVGGVYPAWRAARLAPVEALRYEGGSSGSHIHRLPVGGMAVQSLWQRSTRTLLTLGAIGLTVGAIMALEGTLRGFTSSMTDMALNANVEIMVRQANVSDTELSAIDDRLGARIAAMPEVESASGLLFTAVSLPEAGGFFILQGYAPKEYAIRRFQIVAGEPLQGSHQIILGRVMAEALNKRVGDTIQLSNSRYRIVGIFETGIGWEETGGVITLRDVQAFAGRPRKVTMYAVKVRDPAQAGLVVDKINRQIPEVHAALAGEFVEQMPDMQTSNALVNGISFLAILVGGVGVLNTMLMAVFERTREIGVLRALGWRRRAILGLILREACLLGLFGGAAGIAIALGLVSLVQMVPVIGTWIQPVWELDVFTRAIAVALLLGILGGLYPAYRATRLQPVEALRYE